MKIPVPLAIRYTRVTAALLLAGTHSSRARLPISRLVAQLRQNRVLQARLYRKRGIPEGWNVSVGYPAEGSRCRKRRGEEVIPGLETVPKTGGTCGISSSDRGRQCDRATHVAGLAGNPRSLASLRRSRKWTGSGGESQGTPARFNPTRLSYAGDGRSSRHSRNRGNLARRSDFDTYLAQCSGRRTGSQEGWRPQNHQQDGRRRRFASGD